MKSTLKEKRVLCKALGRKILVQEMSAACHIALIDASAEGVESIPQAAIVASHCVPEFDGTPEEILAKTNLAVLNELSRAASLLSGIDVDEIEPVKNSAADQAVDSCSSSRSH
jgi:hypothetical protein